MNNTSLYHLSHDLHELFCLVSSTNDLSRVLLISRWEMYASSYWMVKDVHLFLMMMIPLDLFLCPLSSQTSFQGIYLVLRSATATFSGSEEMDIQTIIILDRFLFFYNHRKY